MDFSLTYEQQAIRDLARQIFQDQVTHERLRQIEASDDRIDRKLWNELAQANLIGVPLPEPYGGGGLGLFEFCLVLEEAGRVLAPIPLLPAVLLSGLPIARFGNDRQKAAFLPRLAAGSTVLTAALLETGSSVAARPRTTARRDGAAWRLDGEKVCVPAGLQAERILVPARTGDQQLGVFLVDPAASGVALQTQEATNGELQARLCLSGATVAGEDVLGAPEGGAEIVGWLEERATLGLCAMQLGVAEQALRATAEYTCTRQQFGRPIGTFQGVALRAADAYIDIEAMRSVYWQAAWRLTEGQPTRAELHAAAWWACIGGHRVVHTALHLHGGIGADVDYPIHRYLLWAKQIELSLGGTGRHLEQVGKALAG